ncbi:hypothetical protein [Halorarum halobium]|uniref:hypothetical protein n=1 Tax=Halorarum halobium TaxID=3075121 RepID=UPI0028AFA63A|nr:hypothetical protein [Halobaculum sp. XH14]
MNRRIQNWIPDRDREPVFARSVVLLVSRTGAVGRKAVAHGDPVLVVLRVGMAAVPDEQAVVYELELERLVLGAFQSACRYI